MYVRYFLWNFAGKQDDVQGFGDKRNGNWLTGIKPIDNLLLGNQDRLPISITNNAGFNRFYALPFILGLIGIIYQYRKSRKDAWVVLLLFFSTGMAIIIYLNQSPMQVRERDYAYVGSFYAFAICIGLGVLGVREMIQKYTRPLLSNALATTICFAAIPYIMGSQGWDDHDQSTNDIPQQMAINYLQSCAPNAILFTQADNDTYPLWYAQQVLGVRKDIRLVNTELLFKASYINQLKKKLFDSEPLPITMNEAAYVDGIREVLPFVDYGIADSVELTDLFGVLTSDNAADKVQMQSGSMENFLPTKKFKMNVDANQVIKSGTLLAQDKINVVSAMEWVYPKDIIGKNDLAMLDIIAHNNWKRPIYFCATMGSDSFFGLEKYFHLEGYTYRLLPLKREKTDQRDAMDVTHSNVMYTNVMNKFQLSSFKKTRYLDTESQRVTNLTWNIFNSLASNLAAENKVDKAKLVMVKALNALPLRNYSVADTAVKYRTAGNLYALNETAKANNLVKSATNFLSSELNYYSSLNQEDQEMNGNDIRNVLSLLDTFQKMADTNGQAGISKEILGILGTGNRS